MSTAELVRTPSLEASVVEQVLLGGDLSRLSPAQRTAYYNQVCETLGLNPLTQPFAYIRLNGKEVLYAKKDATEQLRKIHGVSITDVTSQHIGDVFVVTAKAEDKRGRTDASTGAVTIANLKGEALANALMKAETKAKRRVTLSICGLGMLDETEAETLRPDPPVVEVQEPAALPQAPCGANYIMRVEPKRKGNVEWADITVDTGEILVARGQQLIALLEQIAQERVPAFLETKATSRGKTEILLAMRKRPELPPPAVEPPAVEDIAF